MTAEREAEVDRASRLGLSIGVLGTATWSIVAYGLTSWLGWSLGAWVAGLAVLIARSVWELRRIWHEAAP